jgi:hypothetical protein
MDFNRIEALCNSENRPRPSYSLLKYQTPDAVHQAFGCIGVTLNN